MSYNKYVLFKKQVSLDGGSTWNDVDPLETTPSGDSIGTYSTILECESMPAIDMDGKLFVGITSGGTVNRSYNCYTGDTASTAHYNYILGAPNSYYTDPALTGALQSGPMSYYNYVGTCVYGFGVEAFAYGRSYGTHIVLCFPYRASPYILSRLMFYGTYVDDIVAEDGVTFEDSVYSYSGDSSEMFKETSGNVSTIISNMKTIGNECFASSQIGNTATFNQKVGIGRKAFWLANFSTLIFNNGFTWSGDSEFDYGFKKNNQGDKFDIVLNGCIEDYPNNVVSILENLEYNVVDNTYLF